MVAHCWIHCLARKVGLEQSSDDFQNIKLGRGGEGRRKGIKKCFREIPSNSGLLKIKKVMNKAIPSISCKFPSPGPHEFGSTHCGEAGPL